MADQTPQDRDDLIDALLIPQSREEMRAFLDDLCTPQELRIFAERLKVARMLDEGQLSYREIGAQTGASTTTITRVSRFLREMPHQGYRLVLDKIKSSKNV